MTAPYDDSREHLRDELRRLDLLLQRYLAEWRADRGGADEGGGLYVSGKKVDRLLRAESLGDRPADRRRQQDGGGSRGARAVADPSDGAGGRSHDEDARVGNTDIEERLQSLTASIRKRERETVASGTDLPLAGLADRFGLTRRHVDVLLVALAPELDLKYETVYAYLQDDLTRKRPTAGLALRIVGGTVGAETDERPLLSPRSPLLDQEILRPLDRDGAMLASPVEVDRRVVGHLLGERAIDPRLKSCAEVIDPGAATPGLVAPDAGQNAPPIERLPVDQSTRERLAVLADDFERGAPPMVHLSGPYGTGRRAAAAALAESADRSLVALDLEQVLSQDAAGALSALDREARLRDAVLHVRSLPPANDPDPEAPVGLRALLDRLDEVAGPVVLSGTEPIVPRLAGRLGQHEFAAVSFNRPPFGLRRSLWEQLDLPGDPGQLASKFRFSPGQIEDAAATARSLATGEPTAEDVFEACRAQARGPLADLARAVEPTYGWDDIVLPDEKRRQLEEVAALVEHRGTVYSEWGFDERVSLGTGVNALFVGPSGTGKTMAAEVVAGEAGLDLYKVDLASVVSKYVGETESNIERVFEAAAASNVVLFFDEADAMFGERSEVSDAHDRYANVEVDYLLERMEEHDGVVLLATNLAEHIDDAFRRRINLTIEFPLPDREARERIWRGVFPDETPTGDLDWSFLADFELTGGSINNAALTAAFLAADDEGADRVEMRQAVGAMWRELQKSGRLVSPDDFGEYREHLP